MELSPQDNPDQTVDLIAQYNAGFTLDIQASGRYTATITLNETPDTETGAITVEGSTITFDPDDGVPRDGTWDLTGGRLEIDGETTFQSQPALLHLELVQRLSG